MSTNESSDAGVPSEKPKLRQITSMEELTAYVEEVLSKAVYQLVDPDERWHHKPYVDVPKANVYIEADINIPGMSMDEAMEAALTASLGERLVVGEADASDDVYVVQSLKGTTAIMLSKVLRTDELIRLAEGAIAMSRKSLSDIPGSTLRVVGEMSDKLFTEADLGPILKGSFLGQATTFERELEVLKKYANRLPFILLTCWFRRAGDLNDIDKPNLHFMCRTEMGCVFMMKRGSRHFRLRTDDFDTATLKELRSEQHRKIGEVLS